ncbi:Holliday junction branch migration protein RuvA [Patescibacteria group bacterium]|nr:MAG: Holliday junction branch migration protein RuvA [Patescibacteria group bacterium]
MLSYLTGKIQNIEQNSLTVLINGIGFEVTVLEKCAKKFKVNDEIQLWTYLNVREDNLSLFGFQTKAELNLFKLLISVSGIGPKVAMKALEKATVEQLHLAILGEDLETLNTIPGIGKKTAERLLVELKSKLEKKDLPDQEGLAEIKGALSGLGYPPARINEVITKIPSNLKTLEQRLKYALNLLGK